ncbi:uncharacterized protein [Ptychodera flava]|uniref:uncharacterized protein n=1 Tax=Ptychodera flava TaxID=63121 RepID=UPI003969CD05
MPHLRVYGYGPRYSVPPVQLSAEDFDLLETLTVSNINITMPKFNSYPDLPKQIPRRKYSAESLHADYFVPRLMLTGFDDSVHNGENVVQANQLKVDDSLVDHRAAGPLTEQISWTRVLPPALCGYFAHFAMMMAMAMTFLTYVRVYEDFLEFEFDLDGYPIAVAACYSFLQMSLAGTTDYIATKITNLENHQSESGYGRLLRVKQGIFNLVGMFSPIIYVIGKVMMARLTMPAAHVSRMAYNSTVLVALAYPWWLTEIDLDACPAEVDTTINECARLLLHVVIVTMISVTKISDADVINDLLNRCRSVFNVQLDNEE